MKILISYSHLTEYIAHQLFSDLKRMGCDPWLDLRSIQKTTDWQQSIEQAIRASDRFIMLWSKEAQESGFVQDELDIAKLCRDPSEILIVRVAGAVDDMDEEIRRLQHVDLTIDYWDGLHEVSEWLGVTSVPSTSEMLGSGKSVQEVAAQFAKNRFGLRPFRDTNDPTGAAVASYCAVPYCVSAYAASWFVMEENARFNVDGEIHVVFNFSAGRERNALIDVLDFLFYGDSDFVPGTNNPRLVLIQGPQKTVGGEKRLVLPNDQPHIWEDCIRLANHTIAKLSSRAKLHLYMNAPQSLTFSAALQFRGTCPIVVYNYDRQHPLSRTRYRKVYEYVPC